MIQVVMKYLRPVYVIIASYKVLVQVVYARLFSIHPCKSWA